MEFDLTNANLPAGVTSVLVGSDTVPSGSDSYTAVQGLVGGNQGLVIYDLKLLDQNGNPITDSTGTIKVKIKIPDGFSGNHWYDPNTNTLTDMNFTAQDGWLVFETSHFSQYAVAQLGTAKPTPTPSPEPAPTATTTPAPTSAGPAAENLGIPGLPGSYTMYTGGRVTWTPGRAGGTWYNDANMVKITQNADGSYTVTALNSGKTALHYTVGWEDVNITLTISARPAATPTATPTARPTATPTEPSAETLAPTAVPTETETALATSIPSESASASPSAVAVEEQAATPAALAQSGQGTWLTWLLIILAGCVVVVVIIMIYRKKTKS